MQNPSNICYNIPGSYGASLIVTTTYGCKDTIKISPLVTVYGWPHADFCIDQTTAPATDPVFNFCPQWSPNPGVTNWVWNFGDGSASDSTSTNPIHSYSSTATANDFYTYDICLRVQNEHGCWDTICKTVELIPEFTFYIPNCFTPNEDHTNEFFFGKGRGIKDYNIWLFDRWGNMIWDCHYTGKNTDWDGNGQDGMPSVCKWDGIVVPGGVDMNGKSGQLAQEDVYVWKVNLTDIFKRQHNYIGHVSVVK
jgi:gliding motility-associated-like protein